LYTNAQRIALTSVLRTTYNLLMQDTIRSTDSILDSRNNASSWTTYSTRQHAIMNTLGYTNYHNKPSQSRERPWKKPMTPPTMFLAMAGVLSFSFSGSGLAICQYDHISSVVVFIHGEETGMIAMAWRWSALVVDEETET
jgi:hypothetical protein